MSHNIESFIGYRRYDVSLPVWNGPLDLLLDLIRASKVKIQDIPIKQITNQYLKMISLMKKIDMDLSADFLVMASTLILIKSRTLIAEEIGEDVQDFETPKRELIEKLLIYEQFKKVTEKLSEQEDKFSHYLEAKERTRRKKSFFKEHGEDGQLSKEWHSVGLKELLLSYLNLVDEFESFPVFQDREYSVSEKIDLVVKQIKQYQKLKFADLFSLNQQSNKQEVIVTFWGVLELYKQGVIDTYQNNNFGDIFLVPGKKINSFHFV